MSNLLINKNEAYQEVDVDGIWTAYRKAKVPDHPPTMRWKGAPIPLDLVSQIKSFFEWTAREKKCESQVRLFYNKNSSTEPWKVWAFPQYEGQGLYTKEHEGDEFNAQWEQVTKGGWVEASTWHHHIESSAFQSGTDKADEHNSDGLHVTLGHLAKECPYDIHYRGAFMQVFQDTPLHTWVELGGDYSHLPDKILEEIAKWAVTTPAASCQPGIDFPKQWADNLIPKPVTPVATRHLGGWSHGVQVHSNGKALGVGPWSPSQSVSPGLPAHYSQDKPRVTLEDLEQFNQKLATYMGGTYDNIKDWEDLVATSQRVCRLVEDAGMTWEEAIDCADYLDLNEDPVEAAQQQEAIELDDVSDMGTPLYPPGWNH